MKRSLNCGAGGAPGPEWRCARTAYVSYRIFLIIYSKPWIFMIFCSSLGLNTGFLVTVMIHASYKGLCK